MEPLILDEANLRFFSNLSFSSFLEFVSSLHLWFNIQYLDDTVLHVLDKLIKVLLKPVKLSPNFRYKVLS